MNRLTKPNLRKILNTFGLLSIALLSIVDLTLAQSFPRGVATPSATLTPQVVPTPIALPVTGFSAPVEGFADLHVHFAMDVSGFGGGWMWGEMDGPVQTAMARCDGGFDHAHAHGSNLPLNNCLAQPYALQLKQILGRVDRLPKGFGFLLGQGVSLESGRHPTRRDGYPTFKSWPVWDAIAHQQVWGGSLLAAHQRGLNIMLAACTDFGPLCRLVPASLRPYACNEMANVDVQIQAVKDFVSANSSWTGIALSPADARALIGAGKLAIVLEIETSDLFGTAPDVRAEVDRYHAMGVRAIQPVHLIDSRFAGTAPISPVFGVVQYLEPVAGPQCYVGSACVNSKGSFIPFNLGFDFDSRCFNKRALTPEGQVLIQHMIDRKMLIDVAHLSEASLAGVYNMAAANNYFPIHMSHSEFRMVYPPEEQGERDLSVDQVEMIRATGGMVGLLPGPKEFRHYENSTLNVCHGSARSFAQQYDFGAKELDVSIAFGSDLNCFTAHNRPRFGEDRPCSASKVKQEVICQARYERTNNTARTNTDFDTTGLGHVAQLPDLIQQLRLFGSDTSNLERSAETFIQMWERAEMPAVLRGPIIRPPIDQASLELKFGFYTKKDKKKAKRAAKLACLLFNPLCKTGCLTNRIGCGANCFIERTNCGQSCRIIKGQCTDSCVDTSSSCSSSCPSGKSGRSCRQNCRQNKRSCKKTCRQDKRECKTECKKERLVCKGECKTDENACRTNCSSSHESCVCTEYLDRIKPDVVNRPRDPVAP